MKLFGDMRVEGRDLMVGNWSARKLADRFQTPLMVYDEAGLREQMTLFRENFSSERFIFSTVYASKAFSCLALLKLVKEEGLLVDVVSGGELYTAIQAGVPGYRIVFHGNNKSQEELEMAVDYGVGRFVLNQVEEAPRLAEVLRKKDKRALVLLRINPGVEAHTHQYIQTATPTSKFGEWKEDPDLVEKIQLVLDQPELDLEGFHCHIGSQIFEKEAFFQLTDTMFDFLEDMEDKLGRRFRTLDLGGGFGVHYTDEDHPFELKSFLQEWARRLEEKMDERDLGLERILIEPGRSLVANFGLTLYEVGHTKQSGKTHYLFVDGGMSDNIRPALYEAKYEAVLANRMDEKADRHYCVAGKLCESGDVLIQDSCLPQARRGDLLAVLHTGAYGYSMASNYNKLGRPAVVFVNEDEAREVIRRETYEDLLHLEEN